MKNKPDSVKGMLLISIIIFVLLLGYEKLIASKKSTSHISGIALPEFSLAGLNQENLQYNNLLGKPYFINFFATWCKVCLQDHHELVKLSADLPFPMYGVAVNDNELNLNKLLGIYGNPYAQIAQDNGSFSRSILIKGLPTIILVNETGKIITSHSGMISKEVFEQKFKPHLNQDN
jgi:cytochrome c biogenesis protein CcmG/thiol:disulfide interchange protein DsbE